MGLPHEVQSRIMLFRIGAKRMPKTDHNVPSANTCILRYGLSVILVAISLSVTLLFQGYTFRTPLFFPAIILSTWFGGTGPGLLAVVLSTLSINYFILAAEIRLLV
jgi:K+-sensing histidine kinase KdpD